MAGAMTIKPREEARWDLVALGEVMLRFDPGDRRIATTRRFEVYEGGGEYNVARGLKRCFGLNTAIVTAFPACSPRRPSVVYCGFEARSPP